MKIVHFSTQETGGGAIAAIRIHRSLLALGHESAVRFLKRGPLPKGKQSRLQKAGALFRPALDRALLDVVARKRNALFSAAWLPNAALRNTGNADVINLHWVGDGFLDIGALRGVRAPIVWTLHDMWAFTGGCFYDGGCGQFTSGCGRCPILESDKEHDLSARVFRRKEKAWNDVDLTLVAPSQWMAREARRSPLFQHRRIEVIQYCLDTSIFKPVDRALARRILNLPCDRRLVLFGAEHPREQRKGYQHLLAAMPHLQSLCAGPEKPEFVLFGEGERERREESGWVWHSLGPLRDEVSLALAYAAADVFVAPSVQDNLPCTVMEAMSCGTPCVAFAIGGMPDLIAHRESGFLAAPFDARELASGIAWVLSGNGEALGGSARATVLEKFVPAVIGAQYARLYADVTGKN